MDKQTLTNLAAQLATPAYIFDLDAFEKRAAMVHRYFGDKTGLCFSIKANPFLLGRLPDIFDKIEVCSPGELTVCEKTGVDTGKIIFSGVNKTEKDVARAAEDEVGTFTAESLLHVQMINAEAIKRGKVYPVLLRVTDVRGGSQFGMEEAQVLDIIRNRADYPGMEIVGIHYFTGTQKKKAKPILRELDYLADLIDRVKADLDFTIERIEYGTGLAVDYFDADADKLEEERL
ncbi:MAG: alanine racemase, partial [Ruminococcus sp.]|nr:alanine racemase [Ruminococcus sp.]